MKRYKVTLDAEERQHLHDLIAAGQAAARKLAHARILLKADAADGGPAWPDGQIADALEVSTDTVGRVRQRFVEQGLDGERNRRELVDTLSRPVELGQLNMPKLPGIAEGGLKVRLAATIDQTLQKLATLGLIQADA